MNSSFGPKSGDWGLGDANKAYGRDSAVKAENIRNLRTFASANVREVPRSDAKTASNWHCDARSQAFRSRPSFVRSVRHDVPVPFPRAAWLTTVVLCALAALILLLEGYVGYAGTLAAVGLSAAINLT